MEIGLAERKAFVRGLAKLQTLCDRQVRVPTSYLRLAGFKYAFPNRSRRTPFATGALSGAQGAISRSHWRLFGPQRVVASIQKTVLWRFLFFSEWNEMESMGLTSARLGTAVCLQSSIKSFAKKIPPKVSTFFGRSLFMFLLVIPVRKYRKPSQPSISAG